MVTVSNARMNGAIVNLRPGYPSLALPYRTDPTKCVHYELGSGFPIYRIFTIPSGDLPWTFIEARVIPPTNKKFPFGEDCADEPLVLT